MIYTHELIAFLVTTFREAHVPLNSTPHFCVWYTGIHTRVGKRQMTLQVAIINNRKLKHAQVAS